jgi:hypothetical protein
MGGMYFAAGLISGLLFVAGAGIWSLRSPTLAVRPQAAPKSGAIRSQAPPASVTNEVLPVISQLKLHPIDAAVQARAAPIQQRMVAAFRSADPSPDRVANAILTGLFELSKVTPNDDYDAQFQLTLPVLSAASGGFQISGFLMWPDNVPLVLEKVITPSEWLSMGAVEQDEVLDQALHWIAAKYVTSSPFHNAGDVHPVIRSISISSASTHRNNQVAQVLYEVGSGTQAEIRSFELIKSGDQWLLPPASLLGNLPTESGEILRQSPEEILHGTR